MLDIFKKKETATAVQITNPSQASIQTINQINASQAPAVAAPASPTNRSDSALPPPKNLPDLAKDLFGADPSVIKSHSELEAYASALKTTLAEQQQANRMPIEPTSISVPKLDINLIKNRPNESKAILLEPIRDPAADTSDRELRAIIERATADFLRSKNSSSASVPTLNVRTSDSGRHNILPSHDNSRGFFNEFERYMLEGGKNDAVSKSVVNELMASNLLEKMRHYHDESDKGLSSKFAELEDLERLWVVSNEKSRSAGMINEYVESEILYKSEMIKKIISGDATSRIIAPKGGASEEKHAKKLPLDIFQILRKKGDNQAQPQSISTETKYDSSIVSDITRLESGNIQATSGIEFEKEIINSLNITDPAKYFYVADGVIVRSIRELMSEIARMSDATFYHHVSYERNDFANWIRGVFNMNDLADAVASQKSKGELLNFLAKIII